MQGNTTEASDKTVLVTTRLDEESHKRLQRIAVDADRTIAAEVRRAVRFYLENATVPA